MRSVAPELGGRELLKGTRVTFSPIERGNVTLVSLARSFVGLARSGGHFRAPFDAGVSGVPPG